MPHQDCSAGPVAPDDRLLIRIEEEAGCPVAQNRADADKHRSNTASRVSREIDNPGRGSLIASHCNELSACCALGRLGLPTGDSCGDPAPILTEARIRR